MSAVVGLPRLPKPLSCAVYAALDRAGVALGVARNDIGVVGSDTTRQQWALAIEAEAERLDNMRRLCR